MTSVLHDVIVFIWWEAGLKTISFFWHWSLLEDVLLNSDSETGTTKSWPGLLSLRGWRVPISSWSSPEETEVSHPRRSNTNTWLLMYLRFLSRLFFITVFILILTCTLMIVVLLLCKIYQKINEEDIQIFISWNNLLPIQPKLKEVQLCQFWTFLYPVLG